MRIDTRFLNTKNSHNLRIMCNSIRCLVEAQLREHKLLLRGAACGQAAAF